MMPLASFTAEEYASLPSFKAALMLRDHVRDRKSFKEIAISHDVSIGTVKSRISRARSYIATLRAKEKTPPPDFSKAEAHSVSR